VEFTLRPSASAGKERETDIVRSDKREPLPGGRGFGRNISRALTIRRRNSRQTEKLARERPLAGKFKREEVVVVGRKDDLH